MEAGLDRSGDVERAFREAYGKAVATLVRVFGDIGRAEDAVQDAFVIAAERWPESGIPPNPAGWIVTTARNRAIDLFRREARGRELHHELALTDPIEQTMSFEDSDMADDQLRLIFTCCHPAIRAEHQVALTLRLLGGLSVADVARSFLVTEAAMTKRLTRAKYKIKAANIPYRVPAAAELPDRLHTVLTVLYLIYNAGADDPDRIQLRREAVRLAREVVRLMPDEPEAAGLLALLLLNESRMSARRRDGEVVLLADQDRSQWDPALVAEGQSIVAACIRRGQPGAFQLQAAIQAVHSNAGRYKDTDWAQILTNYDRLLEVAPTEIVALNRAIALAEVHGDAAGLAAMNPLRRSLDDYYLFHSARGTLLRRLKENGPAKAAFERAHELASGEADRSFLAKQISELI